MAASVRVREGRRLVTDGPFAETREQLGGYFLVEARDLDEAIAIAARIPMARRGTVEVRPVIEIPGLPAEGHPRRGGGGVPRRPTGDRGAASHDGVTARTARPRGVAPRRPGRRSRAMLKKILIALAVIVVAFLGLVAVQPSEFRVARTTTIAARRAGGVRAGERLPQVGSLESVGEARSGDEAHVRGRARREPAPSTRGPATPRWARAA